jgi:hypothetical protein
MILEHSENGRRFLALLATISSNLHVSGLLRFYTQFEHFVMTTSLPTIAN